MAAAARCLREGGLVAFPTETVYGLGADATNAAAIARLYQAKGRPSFNPLIAHVGDLAAAQRIARFDAQAIALAQAFWPGPLTLVLPKTQRLRGGRSCHRRARHHRGPGSRPSGGAGDPARLRRAGGGASANLSGHVSPTTAAHVRSDLAGRIDLIVDGGAVEVGVESTIVGCFDGADAAAPRRPAARRDRARARPRAGCSRLTMRDGDSAQPLAPGMLASHYAPRTPVRLDADRVEAGEALLAFGPDAVPGRDAASTR